MLVKLSKKKGGDLMTVWLLIVLGFIIGNLIGFSVAFIKRPETVGSLILGRITDLEIEDEQFLLLELEKDITCFYGKKKISLNIVNNEIDTKKR